MTVLKHDYNYTNKLCFIADIPTEDRDNIICGIINSIKYLYRGKNKTRSHA